MSSTQQLLLGEGAGGAAPVYIEDVFSTYLYTGNGSTQTITNDIDLSTKGGLVWIKNRGAVELHQWWTTLLGDTSYLRSNGDDALFNSGSVAITYNTTGFSLNTSSSANNANANTYVGWTFREQAKFFDVVTVSHTNGVADTVDLSGLGTVGCVILKSTSLSDNWYVFHLGCSAGNLVRLDLTDAQFSSSKLSVSGTTLTISSVFATGTYVVYAFAHNAGGFGLTGTDNVISCGSFTTAGSGKMTAAVNLGYEPQWLMVKNIGSAENWVMYDIMRGMSNTAYAALNPNTTGAEFTGTSAIAPNATGFDTPKTSGPFANFSTYIYVAIRKGPMRVPTVGTTVFAPVTYTGDNSNTRVISTGFPPDMVWTGTPADGGRRVGDRLRGLFTNPGPINATYSSSDEQFSSYSRPQMSGWQTGNGTVRFENSTAVDYVLHAFKRAPSFFDVVCYTGTGSAQNVTHNLTVAPELVIIKNRNIGGSGYGWVVGSSTLPSWGRYLQLSSTDEINPSNNAGPFNNTAPTSSVFTVNTWTETNGSGATYVAYLFATCAGVSKVGSYTGTGTTLQINCGFTGGARLVLIKRTDSTGDWYLWDSARGIVAGNDPYLLLNSTAAEVTTTDYVDTYSAGFEITSTAPAAINASAGTFIFLAIA